MYFQHNLLLIVLSALYYQIQSVEFEDAADLNGLVEDMRIDDQITTTTSTSISSAATTQIDGEILDSFLKSVGATQLDDVVQYISNSKEQIDLLKTALEGEKQRFELAQSESNTILNAANTALIESKNMWETCSAKLAETTKEAEDKITNNLVNEQSLIDIDAVEAKLESCKNDAITGRERLSNEIAALEGKLRDSTQELKESSLKQQKLQKELDLMKNNNKDSKDKEEKMKRDGSKRTKDQKTNNTYEDVELKVCDIDTCKEEIVRTTVRSTVDLGQKTMKITEDTKNYTITHVLPVVVDATNRAIEVTSEKATTFYEETLNPFLEKNWKPFYEKNLETPINTSATQLQPLWSIIKEKVIIFMSVVHENAYVPAATIIEIKTQETKDFIVKNLSSVPEVERVFTTADEMISFAIFLVIFCTILFFLFFAILKCLIIPGGKKNNYNGGSSSKKARTGYSEF